MRLVRPSLSDINFQCLKQWFLKLIHFHRFFEVLAICRRYQITDFKYIFSSSQKKNHRSENLPCSLFSLNFIISSTYVEKYTVQLVFHRKMSNPSFPKLGLIFPWLSGRFDIWLVRNYQHLPLHGENTVLQTILRINFVWIICKISKYTKRLQMIIFCINTNPKWVTIIYQQMAVLAWVTANVTIKRDTPVTHPWRGRIHHCFWWDMVRDTKAEWFCTAGPLSTKTDFCC